MDKKRKDTKQTGKTDSKKDRHREPVLGLRISGDLVNAVRALAKRNRRALTTEVTIALERYLSSEGLWPPQPQG